MTASWRSGRAATMPSRQRARWWRKRACRPARWCRSRSRSRRTSASTPTGTSRSSSSARSRSRYLVPRTSMSQAPLDPAQTGDLPVPPWLEELPPRQIVVELDRYIVGQDAAKKAVAIAVRNRWRRAQAPDNIRDEITPYNIIMIGPTGVGKTEVARRLARLAGAPFLKVEASKFTEVGYVGRDVESMVRDLVDSAINMVRGEREDDIYPEAERRAEERLLDLLLPPQPAAM